MAIDYAEKERTFIASLKEDTGSDLQGWMGAIDAAGLGVRNDIIDWLRHQGFTFAKASWIERIHHNGGRLIYADDIGAERRHPPKVPESPSSATKSMSVPTTVPPPPLPDQIAEPAPPVIEPRAPPQQAPIEDPAVRAVLASAKGLRPLAEVVVREIGLSAAGATTSADPPLLTFSAPKPFAALLPSAKELRLYGDFGSAGGTRAKRAEAAQRAPTPFPQVVVLTDVRQIDEGFRTLIAAACLNAHK